MSLDKKKKRILGGVGVAAILIIGWVIWTSRFEETDNAYMAAHVATLSSKVAGLIVEVPVEENYKVKKDQVLAKIDPRDYQNALDSLKAQLGSVEASLALADKDYKRSTKLVSLKAVPQQDKDNDYTKQQELQRKYDGLKAQIAQAELNLGFSDLKAPADGTIGRKLAEPGMVVSAGEPLLSFVDSRAPWLVANFKETQLRKMRIGQKAEIEVDSIGGKVFEGEVESFAPGTGATFALIPPDNATGNFTKIVQRLPVRIRFDAASIKGYEDRLAPGLSAEVKVYVK
jgi:membrane fusion protein (multidrug efflux system)